uniref:Uncharacterized protein n=1 Tax=Micrurus surinamensis TaxID=129470 RepID=A0A2D4NQD7_MICSU
MEGHPVNLLFPTVPVPPHEGIAISANILIEAEPVGAGDDNLCGDRGQSLRQSELRPRPGHVAAAEILQVMVDPRGGGYSARPRDVYRARRLRAQPVCVETSRPGQRPVHGYREGRSCPRAQKPLQEFPHRCCLTGFFRLRRQTSDRFPLPQRPGIVSGSSRRYGRPKQKQQQTRHGKGTPMGSYNAEKFRGAISPEHVGQ